MLSEDSRLRLTEICCRIKLNREVSLDERIWMQKLTEHNKSAKGIAERMLCPNTVGEDVTYYE